jgi:nitroreductase
MWIEDCSIACTFIQLAAESLGLGSCWIQVRGRKHSDTVSAEAYISELLDIPRGLHVESIIAVGYPGESKRPHPGYGLQVEKVHLNTFNSPYGSGLK